MVAILNQKWSPKYKDPAIWAKFGFQHDRVKNWALIISCYVLTLFFIHTTSTCIVFLTIFLIFILVAILKIFKTKSTTLSDDLFLCQVSKGSAVWFEFNIFAPWLPRQRPPF
jgi:hypothetical protein